MRALEFLIEEQEKLDSDEFKQILTAGVVSLSNLFHKNGFELRIVGGAVRDLMLGKLPKDTDLASDATPDEMVEMFEKGNIKYIPTGLQHGTITAVINDEQLEITTLRADTEHTGRHATVEFIRSWEEDAKRRDLTYNAMSLDLDGTVYDYFNGANDLQDKVSKFVGDPVQRIQEDYLRILRYFRFQGRIGNPTWEKDTLDAIKNNAKGLTQISGERIWMEIQKILVGKNVKDILVHLEKTGVTKNINLPLDNIELAEKVSIMQSPIVPLASLMRNTKDVDAIGNAWKLSNAEMQLLAFLTEFKNTPLTQQRAEEFLVDGTHQYFVYALAKMQGKDAIGNHIRKWQVPEFPVTGKDLISAGVKPGPNMGALLTKLRDEWKTKNYKPSKEDLLKDLAPEKRVSQRQKHQFNEYYRSGREDKKAAQFRVSRRQMLLNLLGISAAEARGKTNEDLKAMLDARELSYAMEAE